jgi:hypothetical protein
MSFSHGRARSLNYMLPRVLRDKGQRFNRDVKVELPVFKIAEYGSPLVQDPVRHNKELQTGLNFARYIERFAAEGGFCRVIQSACRFAELERGAKVTDGTVVGAEGFSRDPRRRL